MDFETRSILGIAYPAYNTAVSELAFGPKSVCRTAERICRARKHCSDRRTTNNNQLTTGRPTLRRPADIKRRRPSGVCVWLNVYREIITRLFRPSRSFYGNFVSGRSPYTPSQRPRNISRAAENPTVKKPTVPARIVHGRNFSKY